MYFETIRGAWISRRMHLYPHLGCRIPVRPYVTGFTIMRCARQVQRLLRSTTFECVQHWLARSTADLLCVNFGAYFHDYSCTVAVTTYLVQLDRSLFGTSTTSRSYELVQSYGYTLSEREKIVSTVRKASTIF